MTRAKRSRKPQRVTEDVRLGRAILPAGQAVPGVFEAVDIANHSDGDQRKMVRSGERRTIRRKPKLDELVARGVLSKDEAAACQWYADMHSLRYDTVGLTARWGDGGRSGRVNFDHMPNTPEQEGALADFDFARDGIGASVRGLFESVVLHGKPLGHRVLAFAVAVEQLIKRIEGRVNF